LTVNYGISPVSFGSPSKKELFIIIAKLPRASRTVVSKNILYEPDELREANGSE